MTEEKTKKQINWDKVEDQLGDWIMRIIYFGAMISLLIWWIKMMIGGN